MPLDGRELDLRVQKLRKSLKGFSNNPTVDEVHDLRTRTRRVESILQSLDMDSASNERKVLGRLKTIRKRAGKVRDMDVFTRDVIGLGLDDEPDCVVRLAHHLGIQRSRAASKLSSEVQGRANGLRRRLKHSRDRVSKAIERFESAKADLNSKAAPEAQEAPLHAVSEVLRLSQELGDIPRLGRDNLHPYRIEVKRLRYILEMAESDDSQQEALIDELKQVQDLIGDWHDWVELTAIAQDALKQHGGCKLVKKIQDTAERKFGEALHSAEEMRGRYLRRPEAKSSSSRRQKRGPVPGPVLVAASKIAA